MIRPLRARHRHMFHVLAVVIPAVFVAGLLARRPPAIMETLPAALAPVSDSLTVLISEKTQLLGNATVITRLYADARPSSHLAIELDPQVYVKAPDVLVYWHTTSPAGDAIEDGAYLLGALAGDSAQRYALPDTALHTDGYLILYSLGHRQVIGTAPLSSKTTTNTGGETWD